MDCFKEEQTLTCLTQPHEFSDQPREIKYYFRGPDGGPTPNTGFMLIIQGQAEHPNMHYYRKIREEWANRYNVIAMGVEYVGTRYMSKPPMPLVTPEAVAAIIQQYTPEEASVAIFDNQIDLSKLPPKNLFNLVLKGSLPDEPLDFGFIQAVDCLTALDSLLKVLQRENIPHNPRRIYNYGVSMGGHIAQMCNKLAPSTFAAVCDLAGFTSIVPQIITCGLCRVNLGSVRVTVNYGSYYSQDENAPNFYTQDQYEIRNLANNTHLEIAHREGPAQTIVMLQGARDDVSPAPFKASLFNNMVHAGIHAVFHLFYDEDIDGSLVQQPDHTIGDRPKLAEHHGDVFFLERSPHMKVLPYPNNFERRNEIAYPTPSGAYIMSYRGERPQISFLPKG